MQATDRLAHTLYTYIHMRHKRIYIRLQATCTPQTGLHIRLTIRLNQFAHTSYTYMYMLRGHLVVRGYAAPPTQPRLLAGEPSYTYIPYINMRYVRIHIRTHYVRTTQPRLLAGELSLAPSKPVTDRLAHTLYTYIPYIYIRYIRIYIRLTIRLLCRRAVPGPCKPRSAL